jgi:8-oxo-dGTP pyrophosphatase MutT (NUDIX family)
MKVTEIIKQEPAQPALSHDELENLHGDALARTGFWGAQGAGCIFLAMDTGRIGIVHRGPSVEQPNTWGTVGGAIDPGEDPQRAVIREGEEECGYRMQSGDYLVPLDLFESGSFRYTTFIYVVKTAFQARLNWEAQGFDWFQFGQWPTPLHFGIANTLKKPNCVAIIEAEIRKYQPEQR